MINLPKFSLGRILTFTENYDLEKWQKTMIKVIFQAFNVPTSTDLFNFPGFFLVIAKDKGEFSPKSLYFVGFVKKVATR